MAPIDSDPEKGYFDFVVSEPCSAASTPSTESVTTLTEVHLANATLTPSDKVAATVLVSGYHSAGSTASVDSAATLAVAATPVSPWKKAQDKEHKETEAPSDTVAEEPVSPTAAFVAPDGGLRAWCQVIAGFLLNAVAWGTLSMFGIYQLYYTQNLGLDDAGVSWVGSVQTFLTYLFSMVSGRLSDDGYAMHTTAVGTVLLAAGSVWNSFAAPSSASDSTSVPAGLFLSQALVLGLGLGLMSASSVPAISAYFNRRRSFAFALSTMGTSFGGALFPAVVQFLLPVVGFGWAMRCMALVQIVFCIVAMILLRPPPVEKKTRTQDATPTRRTLSSYLLAGVRACGRYLSSLVDWAAFRELTFVLFLVATFFIYWGIYFGFYYVNVYAEDVVGFSRTQATTLLILTTIIGLPARPLTGYIGDCWLGSLDTVVASCIFTAGTLIGWMAVKYSVAGMYTFAVLFGLGNGAIQGIWVGALAVLSGPAAADRLGVRFGMFCTVSAFATLAGPPTASALIGLVNGGDTSLPGSYMAAQVWAGATILAGAGILFAARVKFAGWKTPARV